MTIEELGSLGGCAMNWGAIGGTLAANEISDHCSAYQWQTRKWGYCRMCSYRSFYLSLSYSTQESPSKTSDLIYVVLGCLVVVVAAVGF